MIELSETNNIFEQCCKLYNKIGIHVCLCSCLAVYYRSGSLVCRSLSTVSNLWVKSPLVFCLCRLSTIIVPPCCVDMSPYHNQSFHALTSHQTFTHNSWAHTKYLSYNFNKPSHNLNSYNIMHLSPELPNVSIHKV